MTTRVVAEVFRFRVGGKLRVLFHGLQRAQVVLVEQGREVGVGRVLVAGEGVQDLSLLLVRRGGAVAGHGARGCGVSGGVRQRSAFAVNEREEGSAKRAGGRERMTRREKHRARKRGSERVDTSGLCIRACRVVRCASAMSARRASSLSRHGRDGKRKAGGKRGESGDFPKISRITGA